MGYLDKVSIGLDVAASELKVAGKNEYDLDFKTPFRVRAAAKQCLGNTYLA